MAFIPNRFHHDIFNEIKNTSNNLMIEAVAGSGKTTTLLEIMKMIQGKIIFLAFNKSIAEELKSRCPNYVDCSTLHSAGNKIIRSNNSQILFDQYKLDNIMNSIHELSFDNYKLYYDKKTDLSDFRYEIKNIVSKIKNLKVDYNNIDEVDFIIEEFQLDFILNEKNFNLIKTIMEKNNDFTHIIDFDDMIYFPVYFDLNFKWKYDYVLIDEAQDLNNCQMDLILKLNKPNGRIIFVGDRRQSIYSFRSGYDCSMDILKKRINAIELPLSVCYRCPTSHIDLVKPIVPQIESKEDAIKGIVEYINEDKFLDNIVKETNPVILCRVNAYMVKFVLQLISSGHKAIIKGKKFGDILIKLVKKMKAETIEELYLKLDDWKIREKIKLDNKKIPATPTQYENINDKYFTLIKIMDNCKTIGEVTNKLNTIFSDNNGNCFTFSTVHKFKGGEADTVYIIAPHLIPLKRKNQTPQQYQEELNIKYVAYTRSKNKLVIVEKKYDKKTIQQKSVKIFVEDKIRDINDGFYI